MTAESTHRHIGLFGATAVGVGAIAGGGILALAGVAFATTGPGAIVAFALNGGIAFLTAASLVVMGIRQRRGASRGLGTRVLEVARASDVPLILLGSRSGRPIRPERRQLP